MNEKLIKLLSMFPVVAQCSDAAFMSMGYSPTEVADAKQAIAERAGNISAGLASGSSFTAESTYGALNWNVVAKNAIKGWASEKLAALVDVFSIDVSGSAVVVENPEAMPSVTVPVVRMGENTAVIDPTNLDQLNGGSSTGVAVQLHLIGDGVAVPFSAIMAGHTAENMVAGVVESVRRKVMHYVLSQLAAATPDTVTVPTPAEGWGPGYVNRELSGLLEADNASLLADRKYFAGLQKDNANTLGLSEVALDGVYKCGQMTALGAKAVGLLAAPNAMAVAMRAPVLPGPAYPVHMQFVDGDTRLPLTMVQYFKPGEMAVHVKVLAAVGAAVVDKSAAAVLVTK